MATEVDTRPLSASIEVAASPATVWSVVSDVRRTGEWSPECRRVIPLGAVRPGAWLVGLNRRANVHWATLSRVTVYEPEAEIGWRVLTNRAEWRYRLQPSAAGTRMTQARATPRGVGRVAAWFTGVFLGGQAGHDDELERGMSEGLAKIKAIAEALEQPGREGRAGRTEERT